jgi:hypothetical protein
MDGKIWMLGREGVHYRAFVSVPAPRGTAVGAQNKRDHFAPACSTELSTTRNVDVVHAAARILYLTSEQENGHGPIRVTSDVKAASYGYSLVVRFSYMRNVPAPFFLMPSCVGRAVGRVSTRTFAPVYVMTLASYV